MRICGVWLPAKDDWQLARKLVYRYVLLKGTMPFIALVRMPPNSSDVNISLTNFLFNA